MQRQDVLHCFAAFLWVERAEGAWPHLLGLLTCARPRPTFFSLLGGYTQRGGRLPLKPRVSGRNVKMVDISWKRQHCGNRKHISCRQELGLGGGADHKEQQEGVWSVVEPCCILIMRMSKSVTLHRKEGTVTHVTSNKRHPPVSKQGCRCSNQLRSAPGRGRQ